MGLTSRNKTEHYRAMARIHILLPMACCLTGCPDGEEGSSASDSSVPTTSTTEPLSESSGGTQPDEPTGTPEPTTTGPTSTTGTDSSDTSTTADTEPEPMCNNGILEGDEECDNAQVSNDGPCLLGCKLNVCGDGFQNLEVESCDEGEQNGMYGVMCDLNCELDDAEFCGDGLVQESYEDCEPGEVHSDFDIECQDCSWAGYRVVFVTSVAFDGAMAGGGLPNENNKSGVALADYRCQQLADTAEVPGTFHAWLSDNNGNSESNVVSRLGAIDPDASYRMRNGGMVAPSWEYLVANGPNNPITYTEHGVPLEQIPAFVWTNTTQAGTSLGGPDCVGWTNDTQLELGNIGITQESGWTDFDTVYDCHKINPLYCFQGED